MLRKIAKSASGNGPSKAVVPLSVIGPDVRIVGDILTQGEMQIDGQVEGDITCQTLVVGEGARINGEVTADKVRVHGELTGKITGGTIVIARTAKVTGDISHESLEIEGGAQIEGHLLRKGSHPKPAAEKKVDAPPFRKVNGSAPVAVPATLHAEVVPAEVAAAS